jgi:DNA modification methylase
MRRDLELSKLKFLKNNPRTISKETLDMLKKSMTEDPDFLQKRPVLVNVVNEEHIVYAGNMRVKAARELKWDTIHCDVDENLDEELMRVRALKDNQEYGEWDYDILANEWEDILQEFEMPELEMPNGGSEGQEDDFNSDSAEKNIHNVQLGDVFQLGDHRLMCGDCTTNIDTLLDKENIDCVLTDPPYGMNLDTDFTNLSGSSTHKIKKYAASRKYARVINDDKPFDPTFIFKRFPKAKEIFLFGANYYADKLPNLALGKSSWFVWDKKALMQDAKRFSLSEFELIYSYRKHHQRIYRHQWFGAIGMQFETQEFDGSKSPVRRHPNQKPVPLLVELMTDYTKEYYKILDLFGGSGSTLIACEQLDRKCYMMELDPHYCSVIIERWEKLTGKQHKKVLDKV